MFKLVVLLSAACVAAAAPGAVFPLAYSVLPASSLSQYSSSVVHGAPLASVYAAGVYAPLAQPPHAPAVVLDAVRGVPLDTPEVVAARAAHFQAKALSLHHLRKRSVVAPYAYSAYSAPALAPYAAAYSPLVSAYSAPVLASPLAYHGVVPKAYSVHPW